MQYLKKNSVGISRKLWNMCICIVLPYLYLKWLFNLEFWDIILVRFFKGFVYFQHHHFRVKSLGCLTHTGPGFVRRAIDLLPDPEGCRMPKRFHQLSQTLEGSKKKPMEFLMDHVRLCPKRGVDKCIYKFTNVNICIYLYACATYPSSWTNVRKGPQDLEKR